mgnify:CR=1 FL=1
MGLYKHLRELWKKPDAAFREVLRQRLIEWSKEAPATMRLERPTRIDRARSLGYKAKQGFVVARVRIKKGGRRKPSTRKGRKPKSSGVFFTPEAIRAFTSEAKSKVPSGCSEYQSGFFPIRSRTSRSVSVR